jgi:hypothetical protein
MTPGGMINNVYRRNDARYTKPFQLSLHPGESGATLAWKRPFACALPGIRLCAFEFPRPWKPARKKTMPPRVACQLPAVCPLSPSKCTCFFQAPSMRLSL